MKRFRPLGPVALCALVATMLTGCTANQQVAQTGPGLVPPGQSALVRIAPDKEKCTGPGGVTVAPCPLRLTKENYKGVRVTIAGPGVVAARLQDPGGCQDGICVIRGPHGSPRTHFDVASGTKCNVAHPVFSGYTASHQLIGTAPLTVINKIDSDTGKRC
jgi:hypothetical protein